MKSCAFALFLVILVPTPQHHQPKPPATQGTWYEQALRRINPTNIDYGSIWEQHKRAMLHEIGNRYFQYSFASTIAIVILIALFSIQRASHHRALEIAAQSLADVLRHDEYSRRAAHEAIDRYNEHIEACNRVIERASDGPAKPSSDSESELSRVRRELADTREENRALRNELANKQKIAAETQPLGPGEPIQREMEFTPALYVERINALEKQLRAEQRKNQTLKGTSVHDHRRA